MYECLILNLQGVLQAWGKHTFETYRPTEPFPTRSGLTGFLAAALGLSREDDESLLALDRSYTYAVRLNAPARKEGRKKIYPGRLSDFHTVQNVRTLGNHPKETELSRREYLEDCRFTVALRLDENLAKWTLSDLERALRNPKYTLFLGRKSCPLCCPPFEGRLQAESLAKALQASPFERSISGLVYSEEPSEAITPSSVSFVIRDVPMGKRRFGTRSVHMFQMEGQ